MIKKSVSLFTTMLLISLDVYASTFDPVSNALTVDSIVVGGNTYANVNVALTPQQVAAATASGSSPTTYYSWTEKLSSRIRGAYAQPLRRHKMIYTYE